VTDFRPVAGPAGILIARPEMMALANALEQTRLTTDTMSEEIGHRIQRRCCKDLGRILAPACMAAFTASRSQADGDPFVAWATGWHAAIGQLYPGNAHALSETWTSGLKMLLDDEGALEEACHSCIDALLAS
jgi:hypothetical protein